MHLEELKTLWFKKYDTSNESELLRQVVRFMNDRIEYANDNKTVAMLVREYLEYLHDLGII